MTAINAWTYDGTSRAHITLPSAKSLRTDLGTAKTIFTAFYLTSLAPGDDGYLYHSRAASNSDENWALQFRDTANALRPIFNASSAGSVSGTIQAATWYLAVSTHSGTGNDWLTRVISLPTGALVTTCTGTGSSNYFDGQEQNLSFGARFNGTVVSGGHIGRLCLMGGIANHALSEAESLALAVDPLNEIDALLATHGANMWVFDDSDTDISTNAFALTLTGTVALGSGNGPDIPDRDAPVADGPSIQYVSNGDGDDAIIFDTLFEGELFAEITGVSFGATQGAGGVFFNIGDTLDGSEVEYTGTLEWSDTLIRLVDNIDLGTIVPGPVNILVQNDDGLTGSLTIEVKATPGADQVGVRGIPPPVTVELGESITFDASKIFFRADCQEGGTFAYMNLPLGLSGSAAGLISGTVSHSAESSYTAEASLTDPLGASASDVFVWTVLDPGDPDPEEPDPEPGEQQPGVVRAVRLADTSRSVGIA
jgi:hypothetical protein